MIVYVSATTSYLVEKDSYIRTGCSSELVLCLLLVYNTLRCSCTIIIFLTHYAMTLNSSSSPEGIVPPQNMHRNGK